MTPARSAAAGVSPLRWLHVQAGDDRRWGRVALLAGGLQTLAAIVQAGLLAWLLHRLIIVGEPLAALATAYWSLPACFATRALAGLLRDEAGARASLRIRQGLRARLLDAMHRLGPAWVERRHAGALANTMLEQVEAVDGYFARYRPQQQLAVLAPLLILAAVLPWSWAVALILLLTAPLIPLFMVLVGWGARRRQNEQLQALQRMSGHFLELVRGLPTLRLLDAHRRQEDAVAQVADAFRVRTMGVLRLAFLSGTVLEFFASVAIALSAVFLGFSLLGYLEFGFYGQAPDLRLAFFVLLLAPEFYQPLRDLGTHYHARAEAEVAAVDLRCVLDAAAELDADGSARPTASPPALEVRAADFHYRAGETVLRDCTLSVAPGEAVAILGASGGGKTTLLRLLLGELRAQRGEVRIGGVAVGELDTAAWRERIGWMSQHPRLMAASLAENLRVARADADAGALEEALAFAGLGDWYCALPEGLATPLGEGGRALSGGQLRRLALARLRLRQADVLLLDEPTASLDAETEALVVARLAELRRGRSAVLLTHRRAPLALADRVLLLEGGALRPASSEETGVHPGGLADSARRDVAAAPSAAIPPVEVLR